MRTKKLALIFTLSSSLLFAYVPSSFAAKIGAPCKKLNAKSWDGENPIVCKKKKKGKLVWTSFSSGSKTEANPPVNATESNSVYKEEAKTQLISNGQKIKDAESRMFSASSSYYENLCKGPAYIPAAETWKKAVDSYEKAIQNFMDASDKLLARFPELKELAPVRSTTPQPTPCPTPTPNPSPSSNSKNETVSQTNAVSKAKSYLSSSGFSRTGLIKQLEFEGFSNSEAIYGVDAQNADWKYQAERKAKSYLSSSGFSRTGLIKQLEFEGFSNSEAIYGVDAQKADWYDQAVRKAKSYLSSSAFSRTGLIKQLEFEGFSNSEATYGTDMNGFSSSTPTKPGTNQDSAPSNNETNSDIPIVGRVFSGTDWAAYEISNPSSKSALTHPSFTVTSSSSAGVLLIEGRNDKFPMILPNSTTWMYMPFASSVYGSSPSKVTLTKYSRTTNRPTNSSEWPLITNAQLSGSDISFTLTNRSNNLRLTGESIYYYFCLNSSDIPIYAAQALTYTTLLPGGSTQIKWFTSLKVGQCSRLIVNIGPVYS